MKTLFKLNGKPVATDADGKTSLLFALREDFSQNGPKFGCGKAQCGSCSVLVDGQQTRACVTPLATVSNRAVTTLDGLSPGEGEALHTLQQAFMDEQAAQCGYCTNGMIMQAISLLDSNPAATEAEIRQAMASVLCRCGSHHRVIKAIQRAQRTLAMTGADL